MSTSDSNPSSAMPTDQTGAVVNVVERDIADADENGVDKVLTPSANRVKEQDAEAINRKAAEVERKLAETSK